MSKKIVIDANSWAMSRFIARNDKGEYFFDSNGFSKVCGKVVNEELAAKGEKKMLDNYLEQQLQLL